MVRVTDTTKAAYKSDATVKDIEVRIPDANITLTNDDILFESLELKEAIEEGDNLSFIGCIASSFKIECFNLVDDTLEGMWIEADIVAHTDDPADEETIPLFRGYIDKVTNTTHEEFTTEIRAYDALYRICNADVTSWYNGLTFPITVKNMRNSFFTRVGVTQVDDYLPNDSMTVNKTIEDKTISGQKIIRAICQINGRFGRINRAGSFEYVHLVEGTEALYPREDLFPDDDIYPADENALDQIAKAYYSKISFENYQVSPITKVQLVNKDGQIQSTAGNGSNAFTVESNPLIWGKSTAQLNSVALNLLNTVKGLWYVPSEVSSVGLPYVECGDFVLMAARRSIVRAYVLSRILKGIQALTDDYSAPGDKTQPVYVPSVQTQIDANAQAISTETTNRISAVSAEASARASAISSEASARANADANEASIRANQISAVNVRCDNLVARDAQITNLVAQKANITDLQATNATVGNLIARTANVENLVATKASISDLNAVSASIGNLNATKANISDLNAVNARISNLEATRVTADYVAARYVTASQVNTAVNNAMQGSVTVGTLRAGQIYIYDGAGYISLNTYVHRYA